MKNVNYYLLIVASIFVIAGCASIEKQRTKAKVFYQTHPEELAELCLQEFPIPELQYIRGETKTKTDTVWLPGQKIPCPPATPENPIPEVKCPDIPLVKTETETTDTIKWEDTRKIFLLQDALKISDKKNEILQIENEAFKDEIRSLKNARNNWRWAFIALAIVAGLFVVFKIVK